MSVMESVQKARDNYKSLLEKAKELDEEGQMELYLELQAILGQYVKVYADRKFADAR